jgi:1-acyl-sn-glycerol-3-phosphate acyltransferase
MRALLKWLGLPPLLALFGFSAVVRCLLPADRATKRRAAINAVSFFSRALLVLLGIRIRVNHRERLRNTGRPRLIVANHLSYIDVLVISSLVPCAFITSVELKRTALLGPLARLSGSIFVERRKPSGLKREIGEIAQVLGQGLPVALFPEGTTSNGDRVRQFKNSLFDAAIHAHADVVPVCLRYTGVNGKRLTGRDRDRVFYYGGVAFMKHFPKLLTLKLVDVEIIVLKQISVQAHQTRKDLASETHEAIHAAYHG